MKQAWRTKQEPIGEETMQFDLLIGDVFEHHHVMLPEIFWASKCWKQQA
jgi:hypothetical protein